MTLLGRSAPASGTAHAEARSLPAAAVQNMQLEPTLWLWQGVTHVTEVTQWVSQVC